MTHEGDTVARPVTVVGAGTIGLSWAALFTVHGFPVVVTDSVASSIRNGRRNLSDTLVRLAAYGVIDGASVDDALARVEFTADWDAAVGSAVWVQEAVPESIEAKREVFARLDRTAPADAVLASSSSALRMTDIAEGLSGAARCVVVHPTNPPHLLRLVEVVPGAATEPEVVERAVKMMLSLDRAPIVCRREIAGFVLNRLQFALVREAMYLFREGVVSIGDIDRCVSEGLGPRWAALGPFAVEDSNSKDLETGLVKFGDFIREMFDEVCQPYAGPDEDDVQKIVASYLEAEPLRGAELIDFRDQLLIEFERLKRARRGSEAG